MLSVTPPLFQLTVAPTDVWQSNIKVVNGNNYPLTVYTEVVNFSATGEGGQGSFEPILKADQEGPSLAHWISISGGPHTIPSEQTKDISFFVEVPENAPPGGHYAAVLVSTQPESNGIGQSLQTSQAVTSLFFIKIEGEINELGRIREFSALDAFLEEPNVNLSLRFENKGNVHLQPKGDIIITNMWGTERGTVPVNYQTHFGNVLPDTIRDFRFEWKSEFKITDIGRYTAEAVLTYGENGLKSETAKAHFWVIPVKSTAITVGIVALFIWIVVRMVRAYIRKMLMLAGVDPDTQSNSVEVETYEEPKEERKKLKISSPIKLGILDLRDKLNSSKESFEVLKSIILFVIDYKRFFISIATLIIIFLVSVMYIGSATETDRDYEVKIQEGSTIISE
jgi:hypothetical protein